ncbi:MAG: hypothetical protein HY303_08695 [Candidatus Wallbacteria bacterium]|nr:hypothetical protein [Candidatus Wallbacteria bacterium]
MKRLIQVAALAAALVVPSVSEAGAGQVEKVRLIKTRKSWDLLMVLLHEGKGERYGIDGWNVTTDRGERLKTVSMSRPRTTAATYESWMTDVAIPPDAKTIAIHVHDKVHGYEGAKPFVIDLSKPKGEHYEIAEEVKPLPYRKYFGQHVKRLLKRNGGFVPYVW